jgi:hypothetical protein
MGIEFKGPYVLIDTHVNPSAGYTLVLDKNFELVGSLYGFATHVLPDGAILFESSLVHFAPMHQAKLKMFLPNTKQEMEVFPGTLKSPYGGMVMKGIHDALIRIGKERGIEASRNGFEIVDFDRSIGTVHLSESGGEIGFTVWYGSDRFSANDPSRLVVNNELMPKDSSWPAYDFAVIARCARNGATWTCREEEITAIAKRYKLPLPTERSRIEELVDRVLREK